MSESLSNLAEAANAAIVGSIPKIDDSPPTEVKLLRGVFNATANDWEKVAVVRELTGEDEEYLAAIDAKEDLSYGDYLNYLLQRSVVSIGSINLDNNNKNIIDELIIGDRDLLFLGVIRATYGRGREMQLRCGSCNGSNDVTIDLDNDFNIENGDVDVVSPVVVQLKNGQSIHLNYPTTGDSRYALKKGKTTAEQNTYIISRCLITEMDRETRENWSKKLSLVDRKKIVKELNQAQPGPRMEEVKTQCAHCDEELTVMLDWVSLLFG